MIFQHKFNKVLSGEKTQTRRLLADNHFIFPPFSERHNAISEVRIDGVLGSRRKWRVGDVYSVQPGRGVKRAYQVPT